MPVNKGLLHEDEMISFLNNKRIKELDSNLQSFISDLFGVIDQNDIVKCEYGIEYTKPDFVVTYRGKKKYVSLKSGEADLFHQEKISTFIQFLRSQGISDRTLKTIVYFQYGDGTLNGSGERRLCSRDAFEMLKKQINLANIELNEKPEFVQAFINRVIFQGVKDDVPPADTVYKGTYMDGVSINRKQISEYFKRGQFAYLENLHVGPLLMRPHARYANRPVKNADSRHRIDIYWPTFDSDIYYIRRNFDGYVPIRHQEQNEPLFENEEEKQEDELFDTIDSLERTGLRKKTNWFKGLFSRKAQVKK